MDQYGMIDPLRVMHDFGQLTDIMTVHRSEVGDAHIFKEHTRNDHLLDGVLRADDHIRHRIADHRKTS